MTTQAAEHTFSKPAERAFRLNWALIARALAAWGIGVVVLAPVIPVLAMILTMAYELGMHEHHLKTVLPLTVGPAVLIAIFAPLPVGLLSTVRNVNPSSYQEALVRLDALQARVDSLCPGDSNHSDSCRALHAWLDRVDLDEKPALRWAMRDGYIDLWRLIHRAEECVIAIETPEELRRSVEHDRLRLHGSKIPARDKLESTVKSALQGLDSNDPAMLERARNPIMEVRRAVNSYRDGRFAALVRTRNLTNLSAFFVGSIACAILVIAALHRVPLNELEAAAVFFLVGATAGFFHRAFTLNQANQIVDDYGASSSELYRTLILSGVAGVGGLVVIASLSSLALPTLQGASDTSQTQTVDLSKIFDTANPFRLVLAAAFGLSPELLVTLLRQQGLREQLKSTKPGEGHRDQGDDA